MFSEVKLPDKAWVSLSCPTISSGRSISQTDKHLDFSLKLSI